MEGKPLVAIIIGSESDESVIEEALKTLDKLGIPYEVSVISAHRNPNELRQYCQEAKDKGIEVIISAAGMSAVLPGIIASLVGTEIPVIGVAVSSKELGGIDALLAITRMPAGVPLVSSGIGIPAAKNAALVAAVILGRTHTEIAKRVKELPKKQVKIAWITPETFHKTS